MKITSFDKPTCRTLATAVEQALQKLGEEFGVSISYKGGSFNPTSLTMKIEAAVIDQDGLILSKEANIFKNYCKTYNLEPDDLGKTFTADDGTTYKITGLSARSGKCPIIAESLKNGKTYKLPARTCQKGLGRTVSPINNLL